MGDFAAARSVYREIAAAYPEDYRPPMRLAFLALEEQANLPNEQRDYSGAASWRNKAVQLYEARPPRAGDDSEMQQLKNLMNELRQHGWI
jgi:hypothetical protein